VDPDYLHELFGEFGKVQVRRMFGGAGVYCDGLMFALVSDGVIYLKADADTVPEFERENCAPFQYDTKTGKRVIMSYWRMPERLYDDTEELARWARRALAVARTSSAVKKSRKPGRTIARKEKRF
jgi:DNA transformation protein and related proteins